jgi:hypothetical protein
LEPEIKKARQDLLFYPSVAMNKRVANSGECFFLGQPGGMADRKEKSRELEQSFVLDFFLLHTHNLAQMCTAHLA